MILGRKQPTGNPDPLAFLERLSRSQVGDGYTDVDRYRDFRRVFLERPEGCRVLWQLFEMAHLFAPVAVLPGDPYEAYHRDGARNLALAIFAILNADPNAIADNQPGEVENE